MEESEQDIYESQYIEEYLDDDCISCEEEGFMQGYILS